MSVIGPLWQSTRPSGIAFPSCTHVAPDACPVCDGTAEETREFWSATPAQRREHLRQMSAWRARQARTDTEAA